MIRVVTYNLSGCRDADAATRVIAAIEPDILIVLGMPSARRLRQLLRSTGLSIAIRSGEQAAGNAIVVRETALVRAADRVRLSAPRRSPSREASHAIVSVRGTTLAVTGIQFGLRPDVRGTNLAELERYWASIEPPLIIGTSINESVGGPVAAQLARSYQDAFARAGTGMGDTYPAEDPVARRDFVFVDQRLPLVRSTVAVGSDVEAASRHRPVIAELQVGDAATQTEPADRTVGAGSGPA